MLYRLGWLAALLLGAWAMSCRNGTDGLVPADRGQPRSATSVGLVKSTVPSQAASAASAQAPEAVSAPWPPAPPAMTSDFCIDGISALDEETCYVLPDAPTSELLIYFHGIVPPSRSSQQKTNFETVVKNAARRAGVAALMPRGEQGLAPKGHAGWWGWPTTAAANVEWSAKLVAKLADKRHKLEQLVGKRFTRQYVAGSSSGAYFTIALALSGQIAADGFAALSGAASRVVDLQRAAPKPFYIGYGTTDSIAGAAQGLGNTLRSAGWPVKVAAHRLPHGTAEVYLDEAFAFWRTNPTAGGK